MKNSKGRLLDLQWLSAGEQQLFFLFCSAALSQADRCVFLIDEPELSLNVGWQRSLLRALLNIAGTSPTQFIVATHSLEILTEYRHRIIALGSVDK